MSKPTREVPWHCDSASSVTRPDVRLPSRAANPSIDQGHEMTANLIIGLTLMATIFGWVGYMASSNRRQLRTTRAEIRALPVVNDPIDANSNLI